MKTRQTMKNSLGRAKSARRHKLVIHRDTIGRLDPLEVNDDDEKKRRSEGHQCPSARIQNSGCETCATYPKK